MTDKKQYPEQGAGTRMWSGGVRLTMISCLTVLSLLFTCTLLQADDSQASADARETLLSMISGDVINSLAVESSSEESLDLPLPAAKSEFPSSSVYGMGASSWGQLGAGIASDTNVPQLLLPDATFGGPIAAGPLHSLVIDYEGNLWASGDDGSGQFGDGVTQSSTMTLSQLAQTEVSAVAAGSYHSLILLNSSSGKTVMASGEGSMGQLGNGGIDTDTFFPVGLSNAVKLASFGNNSFVVTERGELFGFGANTSGELGTGMAGSPYFPPLKILSSGVVDVAPGASHTLVLMADGSVMAAGLNSYGQFGDGSTDSSPTFKVVSQNNDIKAIAAGSGFSLFLHRDGSLSGAGLNSYGQLGTGDTAVQNTLFQIESAHVSDISAGSGHTVYVTDSGALMGMGKNDNGQLGLGNFTSRLTAATIVDAGIVDVTAGYNNTFFMENSLVSLEIKGLDSVYEGATANFDCYATWTDGKITLLTEKVFWSEDSPSASIEINSGIVDLTGSNAPSTFTITASFLGESTAKEITVVSPPIGSSLWGHGYNAYSNLGLDTTVNQSVAVEITSERVVSQAGGLSHSLYVTANGDLFAMGNNAYGQLGTGDTVPRTSPYQVMGGSALTVAAGDDHSLVTLRDGSLWAMGRNDEGQLGDGTQFDRNVPIKIENAGVVQADGGAGHSVFRTAAGEVWTMGRGTEGQLGNNSTAASNNPYLAYSSGAVWAGAGDRHTLFLNESDEMFGTGDNSSGQLGLISSIISQLTPIYLAGGVEQVATGGNHTLFLDTSRNLYVTGANAYGQLGLGTNIDVYGFSLLNGFSEIQRLWAGGNFSIFESGDNSLYGMGGNMYGQLGNGTYTSSNTPVPLPYINPGILAAGARHVLHTSTTFLPAVSTTTTLEITGTTVTTGGSITADSSEDPFVRGVCWSEISPPTTSDSCTFDGSGSGSFNSIITGLTAGTTYYIRAYGTNVFGTSYGDVIEFSIEKEFPWLLFLPKK